jgi:hypothetical protein
VTAVTADHHHHAAAGPVTPRPAWRRYLLGTGWIRAVWMMALFFGIGAGLTVLIRWLEGWQPIWKGSTITTIELTAVPLGFLGGIGAFDYWTRYVTGAPTVPDDHASHGVHSWRDYFKVNHHELAERRDRPLQPVARDDARMASQLAAADLQLRRDPQVVGGPCEYGVPGARHGVLNGHKEAEVSVD